MSLCCIRYSVYMILYHGFRFFLVGAQEGPYDHVAKQLLDEECPATAQAPATLQAWVMPTVASLEARQHITSNFGVQNRAAALAHYLAALLVLFEQNLEAAFECSALATQHLKTVAEWSIALDQPVRARVLTQLGHAFKFQALKDFSTMYHAIKLANGETPTEKELASMPNAPPKRFLPRLHVEYQVMLGQLHEALHVRPSDWQRVGRYPASSGLRVEVHSICSYKPDPTSKTGVDSPLLGLSVPNHRDYTARHGYRYVVHTESALPDREAHYSKMYVVYQRLAGASPTWGHSATSEEGPVPDWILYIDCDAFFTDFHTSIEDLLQTYATPRGKEAEGAHFLVAEDPGGINTGVFLIRQSPWSMSFLERVIRSRFMVAWDQSMFFWDMVRGALDIDLADFAADFKYPAEVRLIHQAHFNAFVPPASNDWMAHEWKPGDFVRHFAGCPWQEIPCLKMMRETALVGQYPAAQQLQLLAEQSSLGGPTSSGS